MLRIDQIARLAFQHSPAKEQRLALYDATNKNIAPQNPDNQPEKTLGLSRKDANVMKNLQGDMRSRMSFLNDIAGLNINVQPEIDAFYAKYRESELPDILGRKLGANEDVRRAILTVLENTDTVLGIAASRRMIAGLQSLNFLDNSEGQKKAIEQFFDYNEGDIRILLGNDRFETFQRIFAQAEKRQGSGNGKTLSRRGKRYVTEYIVGEYFRPAIEREKILAEEARQKDAQFSFSRESDFRAVLTSARDTMSSAEFDALMDTPPSAFILKGVIHFNLDHPRNRNAEERKNTIAHELTHFELDRKERGPQFLKRFETYFKNKGVWDSLKESIDAAYANSGGFDGGTDGDYMHEIMAIYGADAVQVDDKENLRKICSIVAGVFEPPLSAEAGELQTLLSELTSDVRTSYEKNADVVERNLNEGIAEVDENRLVQSVMERQKVRRNPDEQKKVNDKINADNESKEDKLTPGKLSGKIVDVMSRGESMQKRLDQIRKKITLLPPKEREESTAGLNHVQKLVQDNIPDLKMFEGWMDILDRWDTPETDGGPSIEKRTFLAQRCGYDSVALTPQNRQEILEAVNELIATIDGPLKTVEDFEKMELAVPKETEKKDVGYWKWMKENIFTSGNGVEWMSVYDIIRVFEIHKEAWVAKYKENQERRVYRVAKDTNVRKDLQATLEKQARSANEKQTSDFQDYLKTSGLNYMKLMDRNEGLYYKLSNINQKRAVLEFAAEKAWLYDIDPLNGHNVYGIDFINEFGPEAFLHLVQSYEGGKSKEEKRGHEKVNKRPDIPPMIDDLIHELKDKNLFAAKGIFKRIQEKAKLTHSSLWAMTTFLSQLRKDPDLLKTLDKGLLDDLGNIGIGESAWSLTMFKFMRDDLMKLKSGAKFGTTCKLDSTIIKIENRIRARYGNEPYFKNHPKIRNMEEAVAYILAGKSIVDGDFKLSIFESEFDDYRKWWLDNANTTTSAAKTDDDFFGVEGSDVMLTGEAIIKEVGTRDSTGRPTHQRKAPNFYASVIDRYDDLRKNNPAALLNFRNEMQGKFRQWLRTYVSSNAATAGQMPEETDGKGRYLLDEMLSRGIFREEDIIGALRGNIYPKKAGEAPANPVVYERLQKAIARWRREDEATKSFSRRSNDAQAPGRSQRTNVNQAI